MSDPWPFLYQKIKSEDHYKDYEKQNKKIYTIWLLPTILSCSKEYKLILSFSCPKLT